MILERHTKRSILKIAVFGIIIGLVTMAAAVGVYHHSGEARLCGSCHSMKPVRHEWNKSNHHQFACVECHLTDTHIAGKLAYKAKAGINDLIHETMRDYQVGIGLSPHARKIINGNCIRCHASTIAATPMAQGEADCLKCHRYLVHGRGEDQGGIQVEK